jgi:dihydroorotate dehydrogenase
MYKFVRPLLFRLDPEQAHTLILKLIRLAGSISPVRKLLQVLYCGPDVPVRAFGLDFANPVGLAAGYDKDGLGWRGLACLGFGHIEVGTVTLKPQDGNPRPRLFRLPGEQALINRMGFPGQGADFVIRQLRGSRPSGTILGINLGLNKDTPLEAAGEEYIKLMRIFAPLGDYLVVNISSPNTVGLRRLQARQALESLLGDLAEERRIQFSQLNRHLPILVKLSPDLDGTELEDALEVILREGMDGVIATNTTVSRAGLEHSLFAGECGGLSGAPLEQRSTWMVRRIFALTNGKLPIIGVGGVMGPTEAKVKLDAGATLVQLYTGLIYAGPSIVKRILGEL